jgi:hypothetical protein
MQLRYESIEHVKRDVVKIEVERIAKQLRKVKWNYMDSLALTVWFARLEYMLVSNYPIITKSSTNSKIQSIGWLTTWKQ